MFYFGCYYVFVFFYLIFIEFVFDISYYVEKIKKDNCLLMFDRNEYV